VTTPIQVNDRVQLTFRGATTFGHSNLIWAYGTVRTVYDRTVDVNFDNGEKWQVPTTFLVRA
jgi:hypothetical protein